MPQVLDLDETLVHSSFKPINTPDCVMLQVLDLDETLVHSSFKPIDTPDCIVPVEIEGRIVDVYVLKRPCLDKFMESVGHRFEVRRAACLWRWMRGGLLCCGACAHAGLKQQPSDPNSSRIRAEHPLSLCCSRA